MSDKKLELLENVGIATKSIHYAQEPENWDSQCVAPPLVLSTTFTLYGENKVKYDYSRGDNPTRKTLERVLASLENAKYGLCFSSGIGAITTASFLIGNGDHIILSDDCYGGTYKYHNEYATKNGYEVSNIDMSDLKNVENSLKSNTKFIWIESPTNPIQKIIDIKALCELVRKTHPNVIIAVDNTFATPYFQNPLSLGADIVMHSVTKYLNGHSDVVHGALLLNNEEMFKKLRVLQYTIGAVPSPFDCYMVLRGLKTFPLRMKQHMENALQIANWLEKNPRVEKVIYPFLPSHPQYELAKKQMRGCGGMISFYIKGGTKEVLDFHKAVKIITAAVSLGGPESLVEHPFTITHFDMPIEKREALGITDNFIRFSVGLEDVEDLINDLDQALKKAIP